MAYAVRSLQQHFANDGMPKRILALDGGGLRGILSVAILERIEQLLRERHGAGPEFRLCHYFDLIAGTSTGSIIAAALAMGWTVADVRAKYFDLGEKVFERSWLRQGLLRAKYDAEQLIAELKDVYGADTKLGSDKILTGLLIVAKRLDTGSPWPMSNNPAGRYFNSRPGGTIGNSDYPLWQVVRASTAAPSYFEPETITIAEKPGSNRMSGSFIDGGASPFNNPAFQALMYTTIAGYNIGWPMAADKLMIVSIGTGAADPSVRRNAIAGMHAVSSLLSLMDDCATLQELLLQWLSTSPTARPFDRELGSLATDLLAGAPRLLYVRYNVDLRPEGVQALAPTFTDLKKIASLSEMDAPENMKVLHDLGAAAAARDVARDHFRGFDLT